MGWGPTARRRAILLPSSPHSWAPTRLSGLSVSLGDHGHRSAPATQTAPQSPWASWKRVGITGPALSLGRCPDRWRAGPTLRAAKGALRSPGAPTAPAPSRVWRFRMGADAEHAPGACQASRSTTARSPSQLMEVEMLRVSQPAGLDGSLQATST